MVNDQENRSCNIMVGLPAVAAFLLAACGGDASNATGDVVRRDSAGLAIVETHSPATTASIGEWIANEPHVKIGTVAGDPRYELTEIAGVVRTDDGQLIVSDRGSFTLKFFDSSGTFVKEVSGRGEGPDEITQRVLAMHRCGAGTVVVSEWNARGSWWTLDGEFVGRAKYVLPPGKDPRGSRTVGGVTRPLYSACSPNQRIIMTSWGDPARSGSSADLKEGTAASYPTWSKLWLVDTAGTVLLEMPDTIIAERIMHSGGSGPHMFGRNIAFAMDSTRLFISYGDRPEISIHSFDGKLVGMWRAPTEDLTLTPAMVQQYESATLSPADTEEREYYLPRFELTYPATYPAFDRLHLTPGGYLWAKRYRLPWEDTERWGVFNPEGVFEGYTIFPVGLQVFEIDEDFVVGAMLDELDVPFVQLHRVTLPGR